MRIVIATRKGEIPTHPSAFYIVGRCVVGGNHGKENRFAWPTLLSSSCYRGSRSRKQVEISMVKFYGVASVTAVMKLS